MQTKRVLETIRRIEAKFAPIQIELMDLRDSVFGSPSESKRREPGRAVVEISYLFGNFIETAQGDPVIVKVLEAFHLGDSLLKKGFWLDVAGEFTSGPESRPSGRTKFGPKFPRGFSTRTNTW
jgi:hypothetical protein